jgi:UDP-2-acetamido-2,6-beta-L-arabino-hexul-4-ose reductase
MRIVVTGANGFVGKNLRVRLSELGYTDVVCITRTTPPEVFQQALASADFVYHLAGINRPENPTEFAIGNVELTETLCTALSNAGRSATVVLSSSTQATLDNPYGRSKLAAEDVVRRYGVTTGALVHVFRLTNVFGKWARPNYNSAVATFCHNSTRSLPIAIANPASSMQLVYVDDVVEAFVQLLVPSQEQTLPDRANSFVEVQPIYATTVGELATTLQTFSDSRLTLISPPVGKGFIRALYSTYISYLPSESFVYQVPLHGDPRGVFVEMLKTPDCGQFSYFTAHPGVTRGEHYHHTKTEKFLVIKGTAHFGFRHITSGETHELVTRGGEAKIVETAPGWTHNITNIGEDELIVMLWANEIFDRQKPDTVTMKVKP